MPVLVVTFSAALLLLCGEKEFFSIQEPAEQEMRGQTLERSQDQTALAIEANISIPTMDFLLPHLRVESAPVHM